MVKRNSLLASFKEASSIPPKHRASWAYRVLEEFLEDNRTILYTEFESDKQAAAKQVALTKELKSEDSPYFGKVNVERRGNRVYLERL